MAENENKKQNTKKPKSPLIGAQAQPTTLDRTTKLDIDTSGTLLDNIIEAGLSSKLDLSAIESFTSIANTRDQVYTLIDTMCKDSTISSIVRTYTEDVCETADSGHVVWCESKDPNIAKYINYLLNIINVDKKIYGWTYSLIKYGDVYLRLYRESDYQDEFFNNLRKKNAESGRSLLNENLEKDLKEDVNIAFHPQSDPYSLYVEMVPDPSTMYELTKLGQTWGYIEVPNDPKNIEMENLLAGTTALDGGTNLNFHYKQNDVNVYQADDFVHACLEDGTSRFPETVDLYYEEAGEKINPIEQAAHRYTVKRGKSLLFDAYKVWREKALLESAILLSRITRSGIVRKVGVEVGDMPKSQIENTLRRVKEMFEQKSAYNADQSFSEYTNPGPVENFIYFATHEGKGNITVESVGGDYDPKQLTDLDWWNNKLYAAFGIPKQYFGFTDDGAGFNGGTALTIISSVYAKGVKRIQNTMLQMLTDMTNLILWNKGCMAYLNNFTLKMRAPLTQEELNYRENFTNRISAISNLNALFSDVEDKATRLTILKNLISTLDLSDVVTTEIQKEINSATAAAEKAAAEAENPETETETTETTETMETGGEEMELAPMPESLETETKEILKEAGTLGEDIDLPTPEEANSEIDFTDNDI